MSKAILTELLKIFRKLPNESGSTIIVIEEIETTPIQESIAPDAPHSRPLKYKACREGTTRQRVLDHLRDTTSSMHLSELMYNLNLTLTEAQSAITYLQQAQLVEREGPAAYKASTSTNYETFLDIREAMTKQTYSHISDSFERHINNNPTRKNTILSNVLQILKNSYESLTPQEIAAELNVEEITVRTYLSKLASLGVVEYLGRNRGYYYYGSGQQAEKVNESYAPTNKLGSVYYFVKALTQPMAATEIAMLLDLNPKTVSVHLSTLTKEGRIKRANRKYFI